MQKPSVARIVLAVGGYARSNNSDVAPAVITRVFGEHPDGGYTVNMTVLPDCGAPIPATSVRLVDDEGAARALLAHDMSTAAYWPPRV
jgi:hypothetical protein